MVSILESDIVVLEDITDQSEGISRTRGESRFYDLLWRKGDLEDIPSPYSEGC